MQNFSLKLKIIFSLLLIILALVERLFLDLGPNVELITLVTFVASFYLNKKSAIFVPLFVLAISDIFLGNTNIMLFTWSAYGVIGVISLIGLISQIKQSSIKRIFFATGGGAIASLWFYLWTNFGVWFLDSWGMYPKTFNGLVTCYINGIPFFKNQLFSNLIIIPIGFGIIELYLYFQKLFSHKNKYLLVK